ncbi:MAG: ribonuclease III domain-containing protein [Benniella sp.]|nr:MAG: ribonuclease III domain-containing protein [Benniella sp.]
MVNSALMYAGSSKKYECKQALTLSHEQSISASKDSVPRLWTELYPAFHLRETWRARGIDVVNDFGTNTALTFFKGESNSNQPYHNLTDGRRARFSRLLPAHLRSRRPLALLPAGTAETLTIDRQDGYRGLGLRAQRAYHRTGEAVLTASIDEALLCSSKFTRLLKPKSLTGTRIMYIDSHVIHQPIEDAEWARISGVERVLGYPFKDRSLLATALRPKGRLHARGTATNDALEYLGDSVLELVAALFWLLEGRRAIMTLKERSLTNSPLQAVCLRWGLDRLLLGLAPSPLARVAQARSQYEAAIQGHPTGPYWNQVYVCKTLADAVEAVFGAVFLDCGMELSIVLTVFRRIHWPAVGRYL